MSDSTKVKGLVEVDPINPNRKFVGPIEREIRGITGVDRFR